MVDTGVLEEEEEAMVTVAVVVVEVEVMVADMEDKSVDIKTFESFNRKYLYNILNNI